MKQSAPRVPTDEEYAAFDGAHNHKKWKQLGEDWRCPACNRAKREVMRWALRTPMGQRFYGWIWDVDQHHCHSAPIGSGRGRFPDTIICDLCNYADGAARRKLGLPAWFTFSPDEIGQFVTASPHGKHQVNYDKALCLYRRVTGSDR
jgi:hypothetical protein